VIAIAKKAGGEGHHFRVIQLPFNLAMPEALAKKNQEVNGERLSILEAAHQLGISVMCSASILQGQLTRNLPAVVGEIINGLSTDAQRALQFVRSAPGVTVALVGMKDIIHVEENVKVAQVPPISYEQFVKLFS
jgi:predicted aldo/keto reductase-like oxidoreductase